MPLSCAIDPGRRLVISHASGVLTAEDVRAARELARADAAFDPDYDQLFDLRDVTDIAIPNAVLEGIASSSLLTQGVRRAFIATSAVQYGMARMFGAFGEAHGQNVRVFRDPEAAAKWLGSEPR